MVYNLNLDQYLEIKEDINSGICVFLLDNELSEINSDRSWISVSSIDFYIIRMNESEFKIMDIGVHPKTFIIKNGKEIKEINGFLPKEVIGGIYDSIIKS